MKERGEKNIRLIWMMEEKEGIERLKKENKDVEVLKE